MKRYEAYDSFLDIWVDEIPAHWETHKMKYLFHERSEKGYPDEPLLVASQNMGVVPKNVYGNRTVEAQKDLHLLKLVRVGDFVISLRSFQGGLEYAYYQGIISPAYTVLTPHEPITAGYFRYLAKSKLFIGLLTLCVTGIREGQNIDYEKLRNHFLPVPPREEQDQIVRYLDWQVSKINRLIAAKRKQIALLKEHRTAKINQAVTTGIHSDTQLAYTGYNWLPYAPANWKPVPAKALFRNVTELRRQDDSMLAATQKYGLIEQSEYMRLEGRRIVLANDNLDKWLHTEPNDFIISLRSFQGGLEMCSKPGCVTWHYVVLRSQRDIFPDFYKWFFKSAAYIAALQKTSDFIRDGQDLRFSNFVKVGLFNIPMDEQREIAEYLNQEVPKYDVAIDNLEKQIEQITELRTRLISDVVTGQADVRGIEVPEYEYVAEAIESDENNAEVLDESKEAD
ncbi:MAG: restriction endonuclease subunit S [Clostridiales bacterium]|nr:restriction endonuclease subunit S [Clostridiales bacterium]